MANNQKKYASLTTLQNLVSNIKSLFATKADVNTELAKKADSAHTHTIANVTNLQTSLDAKVPTSRTINGKALSANISLSASDVGAASSSHSHDDRYYTESEVDTKLSGKANSSHTHTIANVTNLQSALDGKSNTSHSHTTHSQANMSNTDLNTIKTAGWYQGYTGMTNAPVQAIAVMEVLVYSPDWIVQRFTVVNGAEYIRHWHSATTWSEWKTEIDSGNIGSQSVKSATKATQDGNGKVISSTYETKTDATSKLTEAKTYADNAANAVKNDLLNNAGAAYDTLKELGDLIDDNKDAIDALETVASGKANAVHSHAISDVTGLQSALDGKAASSHGTHVSYSTTAPVMDGVASVGTASTVARSDHKHPTDTSRASKTEFDSHVSDATAHMTSNQKTQLTTAYNHSQAAHAPSNAQPNQNAFSNIAVSGQTTVSADTTTDTVTFAGSNVSITTDAANDKVTFSVADATTSAKGVVKLTDSTSSTSTTTAATPNSVKSAYDLANTAKTNATTAQSRADSAYSLAEGKVDSLSDLDITATATELNYMDGVTSNVQTQLDGKLSTSGGTISGVITTTDGDAFNRNITTGGTYYYGGTGFDDGAFLGLYGKDQSNYAGQFRLKADNGESFTYLEGMPDGQLRWNNKTVATLNSSGAIPIADGGTGARSSSGALANLGGVPLAGGEMTGALKLPKLSATSTDAYIGSMTVPFQQVYTKNVYIQDGKNDTVSYGDFRAQTTGTASVVGKAQLDVGNSTKTGTAGNARGIVRVYGTGAYYHQIQGDATSNRTLTLPNKTGTLATTDDVSTTKALTTAEYTELEQAGEINANTLYMLTDAEEESPTQVQIVTWEADD